MFRRGIPFIICLVLITSCIFSVQASEQKGGAPEEPEFRAFETSLPAPTADFTANVTSGAAPLAVAFSDTSTGDPTGWAWFFGDETYTEPWSELTAHAGWSGRDSPAVVAMPDGSIVLMGGYDGTLFKNDVWQSTDNGATWTQMNASAGWSTRRSHASVTMPDGSIVLMGGLDYSGERNDVWRSTDGGATWMEVNASAGWSERSYHTSVAMPDGNIVLMGGWGSHRLNDVWQSTDNGFTWTQITAQAGWSERYSPTSVAMPDGSIVLMGGYDGFYRNDVWRSTDGGVTWTQMNASAGWTARCGHASVAMPDGSILLMGGWVSSGRCNDVWRSTDNGATWTQLPDAGWAARRFHTSLVMPGGSIVLLGGEGGNDVWRLQPAGSSLQNPSHEYATAGTYSVTLQALNANGHDISTAINYINVSPASPISGIVPSFGYSNGTLVRATITGDNFTSAASVLLTRDGEPDIPGTNVSVTLPSSITCCFSLAGAAPGNRSVLVSNPDGEYGTLADAFTVRPRGDINGNGQVEISDVAKAAYMVVGSAPQDLEADFNGNGIVDIGDASKIAYYFIGKTSIL